MEPGADLQQRSDASPQGDASFRRFRDAAQYLEQRALACAVPPHDPKYLALLHLERNILQGPEVLIGRISAAQCGGPAPPTLCFPRQHITQCRIAFTRLMTDAVTFAEILHPDDGLHEENWKWESRNRKW